jgi:hypothetical protein
MQEARDFESLANIYRDKPTSFKGEMTADEIWDLKDTIKELMMYLKNTVEEVTGFFYPLRMLYSGPKNTFVSVGC